MHRQTRYGATDERIQDQTGGTGEEEQTVSTEGEPEGPAGGPVGEPGPEGPVGEPEPSKKGKNAGQGSGSGKD